jgi:hypothetical protein
MISMIRLDLEAALEPQSHFEDLRQILYYSMMWHRTG